MARHCLIVSYYFPPTGGGGVQRITKLIKYASQLNWEFTVITAEESGKRIPDDTTIHNEITDSCHVIRIQSQIPSSDSGKHKQINFSYLKRWLSAFFYIPDIRKTWAKKVGKVVSDLVSKNSFDCVLLTSPPYSLARTAANLTDKLDIPVIIDMRDPWSINPYKLHPTPIHLWWDRKIEFNAIRKINYGISAYQSLIDYYKKGIPAFRNDNWSCISNGYDEDDFSALSAKNNPDFSRYFNIGFSGTFYSHLNRPDVLFRAMQSVNKKNIKKKTIMFHHFGDSHIDLEHLAAKYDLNRQVNIHGYLPHQECLQTLKTMDALVFFLDERWKNSIYTIGGKVYEYLRLQKPILAIVPEKGEAATLIQETDSGKVISAKDIRQLIDVLENWRDKYPEFNFKNLEQYSREKLAGKMVQFMNNCLDQHE